MICDQNHLYHKDVEMLCYQKCYADSFLAIWVWMFAKTVWIGLYF